MTGRKTLAQLRTKCEASLGTAPAGDGEVAESLRRFLAAAKPPASPGKPEGGKPGTKKRR